MIRVLPSATKAIAWNLDLLLKAGKQISDITRTGRYVHRMDRNLNCMRNICAIFQCINRSKCNCVYALFRATVICKLPGCPKRSACLHFQPAEGLPNGAFERGRLRRVQATEALDPSLDLRWGEVASQCITTCRVQYANVN